MDKIPKRRKFKDNPYSLSYCEELNTYIVKFKDITGKINEVEIQEKIYNVLNRFELDDVKEMNEYDRHIEHSVIYENNFYSRTMNKPIELEDYIIKKSTFEELKHAINYLPEIQRRRIKKYYFEDKTEKQIAEEENATQQSVHIVLERALKNLKKILKN